MDPEFPDVWPGKRMEMDVDKSRRIREEIPIRDCDTSTIGERSRFTLRDSFALWDLEMPRGYLRAKKFVKI